MFYLPSQTNWGTIFKKNYVKWHVNCMWRHVAWLEWWQWFERKTSEPLIHSPKLWKAQAKEPIKSSDLLVFELGRQKPREHTRYLSHWEHFYSLDLVNQMTWFKPLFYTIFFLKNMHILLFKENRNAFLLNSNHSSPYSWAATRGGAWMYSIHVQQLHACFSMHLHAI